MIVVTDVATFPFPALVEGKLCPGDEPGSLVIRETVVDDWLGDQLITTQNLCEITTILLALEQKHLIPTILELLLYYAQTMVDKNCVETDE